MEIETDPQLAGLVSAVSLSDQWWVELALHMHRLGQTGVWAADGSISMVAWLTAHARLERRHAIRVLRIGHLLHDHECMLAAARAWQLTWHQLGLLATSATPARRDVFDRDVELLVTELAKLSPAQSVIFMRQWTICADATLDGTEPPPDDPLTAPRPARRRHRARLARRRHLPRRRARPRTADRTPLRRAHRCPGGRRARRRRPLRHPRLLQRQPRSRRHPSPPPPRRARDPPHHHHRQRR